MESFERAYFWHSTIPGISHGEQECVAEFFLKTCGIILAPSTCLNIYETSKGTGGSCDWEFTRCHLLQWSVSDAIHTRSFPRLHSTIWIKTIVVVKLCEDHIQTPITLTLYVPIELSQTRRHQCCSIASFLHQAVIPQWKQFMIYFCQNQVS